jgi:Mg2+ and Co2+ transporter CorA
MKQLDQEFSDYLFDVLERKDREIFELRNEMQMLIDTDDEFLRELGRRLSELEKKCMKLKTALEAVGFVMGEDPAEQARPC